LQVICSVISTITSLYQFFLSNQDSPASSISKFKTNVATKEPIKDSKAERNKKESEVIEEKMPWKPWDLIWPKESAKPNSQPVISQSGKYAVKLYWMVRSSFSHSVKLKSFWRENILRYSKC